MLEAEKLEAARTIEPNKVSEIKKDEPKLILIQEENNDMKVQKNHTNSARAHK